MAAFDSSNSVTIWQIISEAPFRVSAIAQTEGVATSPRSNLAISSDGTLIATCATSGEIRLWNASTGKLVVEQLGTKSMQWGVEFSPDLNCLFSVGNDSYVTAWNIEESRRAFSISTAWWWWN